MEAVTFELRSDREPQEISITDAEALASELAYFGPDSDMARARKIAAAIHRAIEVVSEGKSAHVKLNEPYRYDVFLALERMLARGAAHLSDGLHELRAECKPGLDSNQG